jgi:hypothetical protein
MKKEAFRKSAQPIMERFSLASAAMRRVRE